MISDLLNAILGESADSKVFWQIVNQQAMYDFGLELDHRLISKHYLIVSLAEACGLFIAEDNWATIEAKLENKVKE